MNEIITKENKKFYQTWYGIALIILSIGVAVNAMFGSVKEVTETSIIQVQELNKGVPIKTEKVIETPTNTVSIKDPTETQAQTSIPTTEIDKEKAIEIIKANASAKWGTDYEMINFTVKNQISAYNWVQKQTQHLDIMARAKTKWQNDYEMIKYTYENQVEAYNWVSSQTAYPDIMARAKQKWGSDYEMVKYEYEKQVEAYEGQ